MNSFELGEDYDLQISTNGIIGIISNKEQLAQKLTQRFKLFFAEWFLDTTIGVPYFGNILGEHANNDIIVQILTDEILKESEVTDVININSSFINRKFTYDADIISIYGDQNFIFTGNQ